MKYIAQPDGTFFSVAEDDDLYQSLQALPEDRRPAFLEEDDPAVIAWRSAQPSAHDEAVQTARVQLKHIFSTLRERIAKSSHYLQASRWPVQLAAAQDVLENGDSASELHKNMLDLEARLRDRGESRAILATKIINNSLVFTMVGAAIDGIETAALDAIHAAHDSEGLNQVVQGVPGAASNEILAILTPALGPEEAAASVQSLFTEI